jgi:hypothetical protein
MRTRSAPLTSHTGRQQQKHKKQRLRGQKEESPEQEPLLSDGRDSMEEMEVIQKPCCMRNCSQEMIFCPSPMSCPCTPDPIAT